jgi:hypothetical protein
MPGSSHTTSQIVVPIWLLHWLTCMRQTARRNSLVQEARGRKKAWGRAEALAQSVSNSEAIQTPSTGRRRREGCVAELYRGLDAHGFTDLDESLALSCSLASFHPAGNPLRVKWSME